ncbi:MAG: P1 family peptidase [Thermomicrobiales bacterium]
MQQASGQDPSSINVRVGHWTNRQAQTGCSVVLFDRPAVTVADVRGGAPGTRETDLLGPGRLVRRADAILLTGGSAFGLAAADGVMSFLSENERGVATRTGSVPIVPSAVIYDLATGEPVAPNAASGKIACESAGPLDMIERGQYGAGTGATTSKLFGMEHSVRGGVGVGSIAWSSGSVSAFCVVNAFGDVVNPETGDPVLAAHPGGDRRRSLLRQEVPEIAPGESTTLAVVLIDAPVDHSTLVLSSIAAHDAIAHAVRPCHTVFDGDISFAVGLREGVVSPADALSIAMATELAVEQAILDAVTA